MRHARSFLLVDIGLSRSEGVDEGREGVERERAGVWVFGFEAEEEEQGLAPLCD